MGQTFSRALSFNSKYTFLHGLVANYYSRFVDIENIHRWNLLIVSPVNQNSFSNSSKNPINLGSTDAECALY
jgi:hypothetical protein